MVVKGERSSLDGFWWDASLLVGDTAKSSHADASSERETMGMRREGRGWCTVIGVRIVTSGVDNGEGEDDVESEAEDACGDTVVMSGSEIWYNVVAVVEAEGFCVARMRLCIWG